MDLGTIIGLMLAFGAILGSLVIEGSSISSLVNPPAFMLVIGGTIGATMISFPLSQMLKVPVIMRNAFFCKENDLPKIIEAIGGFARTARKDGILALEAQAKNTDNKFLQKGIRLVVDGTPSEMVREILETEIVSLQERHKVGQSIFGAMGGYAPTLGVIGTVMGLINMLAKLSEPGKMGPAIAGAFIATFYGIASANILFLPVSSKLKARTAEEVLTYDMIVEGILSIQAGDNPRMVEAKMLAYLPPSLRKSFDVDSKE